MKRRLSALLLTALCLYFSASLCIGCVPRSPHFTLSVSAETPAVSLSDYLSEALAREAETIDLTAYHVDEATLHRVYSALYATDPSLFFVKAEYGVSADADGSVLYLRPAYRFTGEARRHAAEDFSRRIAVITAPIRGLTPLEQVAYLHDYMILHFTYDTTHAVYDAYSLLTDGRGVCQAYALLFTALARSLGIPAACVTCFDRAHEWNAVMLGGAWYHIDLVWDDADRPGEVLHRYFLTGDEELRTLRGEQDAAWQTAYTWEAPAPAAGVTTEGAPWRTLASPFSFPGDGTLLFSVGQESFRISGDLSCTPLSVGQ